MIILGIFDLRQSFAYPKNFKIYNLLSTNAAVVKMSSSTVSLHFRYGQNRNLLPAMIRGKRDLFVDFFFPMEFKQPVHHEIFYTLIVDFIGIIKSSFKARSKTN